MSFRKYGGINYSSKNNIVHANYSNNSNLNIQNRSGMPNSKEVFDSNIDMNGNSLLNVGCIYFADGTVQCSASNIVKVGATGATGAQGASGATGIPGITAGPTGNVGNNGIAGATGDKGVIIGTTGPTGSVGLGERGPEGAPGLVTGPMGPTGSRRFGVLGATGATGTVVGSTGVKGNTGKEVTGNIGNVGVIGNTGYIGATGSLGAIGETGGDLILTSNWTYTANNKTLISTGFTHGPPETIVIATGEPTEAGSTGTGFIELNGYGGEVIVGGTSVDETALHVYGMIISSCNDPSAPSSSSSICEFTAPSFNATSDYRIKERIRTIPSANLDSLNPVFYYNTRLLKEDFGFLAHEVQEVYPFLVTSEKDSREKLQSLNYIGLIALLIKEIRELKTRVNLLEMKLLRNI